MCYHVTILVNLVSVCPCIVGDIKKEIQLDATQWFIELMIRSTCFGHCYAHHQELETIQMFTAMWHITLVITGRGSGAWL